MKNFKKLLSAMLVFCGITILNPVQANATWAQNNTGWWYTQGTSYATGWTQIGGQWYYFDNNGYMKTGWLQDSGNWYYFYGEGTMAHDTTIDGCYLNGSGAWTTSVPTTNNSNAGTSASGAVVDNQIAYLSATGTQYHKIDHCGKMNPNRATKTTVARAEQQGIGRCNKCW